MALNLRCSSKNEILKINYVEDLLNLSICVFALQHKPSVRYMFYITKKYSKKVQQTSHSFQHPRNHSFEELSETIEDLKSFMKPLKI